MRIADGVQVVGEHLVEHRVGDGRHSLLRLARGRLGSLGGQALLLLLDGLQIRIVLVTDEHLVQVGHAGGVFLHLGILLLGQLQVTQLLHLVLDDDGLDELLERELAIGGHGRLVHRQGKAVVLLHVLLLILDQIVTVIGPLGLRDLGIAHLGHSLRAVQLRVVTDQVAAGEHQRRRKQHGDQCDSLFHVSFSSFQPLLGNIHYIIG